MIRRIKDKDIDEIIKLENETLNTTLGEEMLKMAVTSSMAYYYVYIENNKIIPTKPNKGPKLENICFIFAFFANSSSVIFLAAI